MKEILSYLTALNANNNSEWFNATKKVRAEANAHFEELIQVLILKIGKVDESIIHNVPKELTFKMVRDTRLSYDKTPYNPAMRAHIASKGKLPIPVGYFIMIRPGDRSFLGGGLFADMFQNATTLLRNYICEHGDELNRIVENDTFKQYFTVKGSTLKNVPRGYDPESPYAEWLKYKCLYVEYFVSDEEILSPDFIDRATEIFLAMKPFNDFINRALKNFEMPRRL